MPTYSCWATHSTQAEAKSMARELADQAITRGARFGIVTCTVGVDVETLRASLASLVPDVPFVGVTSCRAVVAKDAVLRGPKASAAMWLCGDVKAAVVSQAIAVPDEAVGRQLGRQALSAAGFDPSFVLVHATPGTEEPLLTGLAQVIPSAPLLGGSAADEDISGKWSVFTHTQRLGAGAVVSVVHWPGRFAAPWVSGAMPTESKGVVTKAEGRVIHEIDGKPAADVYDRWLSGALSGAISSGGTILGLTTLTPLGVMRPNGITLVHPERVVLPKRSIATFAQVKEGETVTVVRSTKVGLQGRPANLVSRALTDAKLAPRDLKGGVLVYCAGCMLAIDPATESMVTSLAQVTGPLPLVGAFHFGEQGCPAPGKPEHGNLMTGMLLLA